MIWGMILLTWALSAAADPLPWKRGMVEVSAEQSLYVEHRPAARGRPTVFLLNGLTWSTTDWDPLVTALDQIDPQIGIVRYDPRGMGQTLSANPTTRQSIDLDQQVADLKVLRDRLNIRGPKVMAGLSYGGGLLIAYMAKHPRDFEAGVALAPFIERLQDQESLIAFWIAQHRLMYFYDPRTDEELYNMYLRILIFTSYPPAEPVLYNPVKLEAVYRMVLGVKNANLFDAAKYLPKNKLHIVGALDDEYVTPDRLDAFWEVAKERAASFLKLGYTKHKIPSQRPETAASWIYEVLTKNRHLQNGAVFEGDPIEGIARGADDVEIPLKKAELCDTLLRAARGNF